MWPQDTSTVKPSCASACGDVCHRLLRCSCFFQEGQQICMLFLSSIEGLGTRCCYVLFRFFGDHGPKVYQIMFTRNILSHVHQKQKKQVLCQVALALASWWSSGTKSSGSRLCSAMLAKFLSTVPFSQIHPKVLQPVAMCTWHGWHSLLEGPVLRTLRTAFWCILPTRAGKTLEVLGI